MLSFRTEGFNGYGIKYSPFHDSRLAVAASANFGLVGNGRLYVLGLTPQGIVAEKHFDTQDGLFDLAWSEVHENQVAVASGDGSVKLFDIGLNEFPIQSWKEHKREVFSVFWNLVDKTTFASSSWDGTVKIWNPQRQTSVYTLPTNSCTYSTAFSPHSPSVLSCVASDSNLRIFDLRMPPPHLTHTIATYVTPAPLQIPIPPPVASPNPNIPQQMPNQPAEVLTHDWNKYRQPIICTAGVDRMLRTFDLRNPSQPLEEIFQGHQYAVRKVAYSPHMPDVILSASYDMTCRVWRGGASAATGGGGDAGGGVGMGQPAGVMDRHTEFVFGVDWCLFGAEGWAGSVGWDEMVWVWDVKPMLG